MLKYSVLFSLIVLLACCSFESRKLNDGQKRLVNLGIESLINDGELSNADGVILEQQMIHDIDAYNQNPTMPMDSLRILLQETLNILDQNNIKITDAVLSELVSTYRTIEMYRTGVEDTDVAYSLRFDLENWYNKRQSPQDKFTEIYKSIDKSTINDLLKQQLKNDIGLCEDSTLSKSNVMRLIMTSLKKCLQDKKNNAHYYDIQHIYERVADIKHVQSDMYEYFEMAEFVAHHYTDAGYTDLNVKDRIQTMLGYAIEESILDKQSAKQVETIMFNDIDFLNRDNCTAMSDHLSMSLNELNSILKSRNLNWIDRKSIRKRIADCYYLMYQTNDNDIWFMFAEWIYGKPFIPQG